MTRHKLSYAIGAVLLVAFAGFSVAAFRESLTPYVDFDRARATTRTVQVAGALDASYAPRYDEADESLRFALVETAPAGDPSATAIQGAPLRVRYSGLRPANFEDAVSVVAIGRYDAAAGEFHADKLLVKCPSKYQGIETMETKSYS